MATATQPLRVYWSESEGVYLVRASHGYRVFVPNGDHEVRVPRSEGWALYRATTKGITAAAHDARAWGATRMERLPADAKRVEVDD